MFLKRYINESVGGRSDLRELYISAFINAINLAKQEEIELIHYPLTTATSTDEQLFLTHSNVIPNYPFEVILESFTAENIVDIFC